MWPQSVNARASHGVRVPCGAPTTGVQVPELLATSQASQVPAQGALQQTPSTQLPLAQSVPTLHAAPAIFAHPPANPLTSQALPAPQLATLQQTPSVQNPEAH